MNKKGNIRIPSLSECRDILNNWKARKAQEETAREKAKQKDEERERKNRERKRKNEMTAAQKNINLLCNNNIARSYSEMIEAGKNMKANQGCIEEQEMKQNILEEAQTKYPQESIDESGELRMKWRRRAYKLLPIIDTFFAFFAINNILTHKLVNSFPEFEAYMVPAAILLSIPAGWFLSIISRMACASLDPDSTKVEPRKQLGIIVSSLILPVLYCIGEGVFSDKPDWAFAGGFAGISFIIQYIMINSFKGYEEAEEYYRVWKVKDAIREEIEKLKTRGDKIKTKFNSAYTNFTESFRNLVIARDEYIQKFGGEPKIFLSQLAIYLGDWICFQYEAIPLHRDADGNVTLMRVRFPSNVAGGNEIAQNDDFVIIDNMMRYTADSDMSLSETLRIIGDERKNALTPPNSDTIETSDTNEPEEVMSKKVTDSASDDDSTTGNNPPDDSDDGSTGSIW